MWVCLPQNTRNGSKKKTFEPQIQSSATTLKYPRSLGFGVQGLGLRGLGFRAYEGTPHPLEDLLAFGILRGRVQVLGVKVSGLGAQSLKPSKSPTPEMMSECVIFCMLWDSVGGWYIFVARIQLLALANAWT